ncbi:Protein phosphatase 2C [Trema orientale]|uniref:protein-serine/threonine phosphatase n=1 Tax=Trema orientale TaxID=63057 RepID=A0A2P5AZH8_TREOI|nr:Protein phosphatase 2C [Trema orientale]
MNGSVKGNSDEAKPRNGPWKKPGTSFKSMESLNPHHQIDCRLEDCCASSSSGGKRMRGIPEVTSCEVPAIQAKFADAAATAELSQPGSSAGTRSGEEDGGLIGRTDCEVEDQDQDQEDDDDGGATRLSCASNGWISVIGRRRVMEDAVAVEEFGSYKFFAVYDGHGGSGVANACRDRLHQMLEARVRGWGGGLVDWDKVMRACFLRMDDEVGRGANGEIVGVGTGDDVGRAVNTVGSTAVVAIVAKGTIVVANCGDSRAVLCRDGVPMPLSRDHKPDRPDERERVEAAGGRVISWNGSRVLGVLATSRSIGDHYLKPFVISEPEVTVHERTQSDAFLVIASDGLWDAVSNEFACEVVRRCFDGQIKRRFSEGLTESTAADAAALLAELAMARGSKDNISVIVVDLKK